MTSTTRPSDHAPSGAPGAPAGSTLDFPPYGAALSLEHARVIVTGALDEAHRFGWRMAVAVTEPSGELVLLEKDDDTQYGSGDIALRKARTAARFRRSTQVFEDRIGRGGAIHMLSAEGIIAVAGGMPIVVAGHVVGAVGVSGEQADQDAQVASAGLQALAERLSHLER